MHSRHQAVFPKTPQTLYPSRRLTYLPNAFQRPRSPSFAGPLPKNQVSSCPCWHQQEREENFQNVPPGANARQPAGGPYTPGKHYQITTHAREGAQRPRFRDGAQAREQRLKMWRRRRKVREMDEGRGETPPKECEAEVLDLQPEDLDPPGLWDMDAEAARDVNGAEVRDQDGDAVACVFVTGEESYDADV